MKFRDPICLVSFCYNDVDTAQATASDRDKDVYKWGADYQFLTSETYPTQDQDYETQWNNNARLTTSNRGLTVHTLWLEILLGWIYGRSMLSLMDSGIMTPALFGRNR